MLITGGIFIGTVSHRSAQLHTVNIFAAILTHRRQKSAFNRMGQYPYPLTEYPKICHVKIHKRRDKQNTVNSVKYSAVPRKQMPEILNTRFTL